MVGPPCARADPDRADPLVAARRARSPSASTPRCSTSSSTRTTDRARCVDLLAHGDRDALVVLHHGEVVLEWLAPGVRTDEQHLMFSVTKSVTGLLAGALATRGQLDLEAYAGDLVPEVAGSAFASATVRQLLDMEASFAFVEDYSPGPDVDRLPPRGRLVSGARRMRLRCGLPRHPCPTARTASASATSRRRSTCSAGSARAPPAPRGPRPSSATSGSRAAPSSGRA